MTQAPPSPTPTLRASENMHSVGILVENVHSVAIFVGILGKKEKS